ncbi:MAG: hypothetical protein H6716_23850 [Polyangiaceae bacterium]|nr:hypothetical protein [Polyangiaceae bacterium]
MSLAEDKLLARLCATDREVVYFPVRHHSPAAAKLAGECIRALKPKAVLIEGPSDFNQHLAEIFLAHDLPIAIYSYFQTDTASSGAYYPFCEYSPEWAALMSAKACGAHVELIDLPWREVAAEDDTTHRYADAELRRGKLIASLCARLHVENFDDLWDRLVEADFELTLDDYLARVHSFCLETRRSEGEVRAVDRRREAFMTQRIAHALAEQGAPLLVLTGGYHSSALVARLEGFECPGTDTPSAVGPLPIVDAGIALTTYSYERLDGLSGYNAGMPSPGFYQQAWKQRCSTTRFDHRELLGRLVTELRKRGQILSTADLIAVETSAQALAALRGRSHVWRRDLVDAVTSALIKDEVEYGAASPFLDAVHAVLRGRQQGRLADGTRLPPLVADIRARLSEMNLDPGQGARSVDLDLLDPAQRAQSRLLHCLRLLSIAGYDLRSGTDFLQRDDMTRLWESWRIHWSPEFDTSCIEAARYGVTVVDAVAARLGELAREEHVNAASAAELVVSAARAGVDTISKQVLDELSELLRKERELENSALALQHLLFLYCHDEVFGTVELASVGVLAREAFNRSLWLLELVGGSRDRTRAQLIGMQALLEAQRRSGESLELNQTEFVAVLTRVLQDPDKPPQLRGASAGILWTLGVADDASVLANLLLFTVPGDLGDFLTGLFALAREVAQRNAELVKTLDRMLLEFAGTDFETALPSLRLAFTYFTPREKHYMLRTLFSSLGIQDAQPLASLEVSAEVGARALAVESRVYAEIEKYDLYASGMGGGGERG